MILHDLISYEHLRLIWWLLIGIVLIAFALTDGFDMGTCTLLPFVARNDIEKRIVINTVGPVWEGNQVWLIAGGALLFAAWSIVYAVAFSGFYFAMYLVLVALIIRPVAFKFRSKRPDIGWRRMWDAGLFIGGAVPALLFGVAVGNVILGVPFHLTEHLIAVPDVGPAMRFLILLRPFALLCGVVSLAMLVMHGSAWLALKTEGLIAERARAYGRIAALIALVGYVLGGVWLAYGIQGYGYPAPPPTEGLSNPLLVEITRTPSWLQAYSDRSWIMIAPIMGVIGMVMTWWALSRKSDVVPLIWSKLAIFGVVSSVGLMMFPMILPSSTAPESSLSVWNASSSHLSLFVMLVATVFFLPIIIAYTAFVYRVLTGKVTREEIEDPDSHSY